MRHKALEEDIPSIYRGRDSSIGSSITHINVLDLSNCMYRVPVPEGKQVKLSKKIQTLYLE